MADDSDGICAIPATAVFVLKAADDFRGESSFRGEMVIDDIELVRNASTRTLKSVLVRRECRCVFVLRFCLL